MPPRDWRLRVEDILDAIARIERYTANLSFDNFSADDRTIDAVLHNLEVIGEAARLIPDEIAKKYSPVPWEAMRGMRNILAHE